MNRNDASPNPAGPHRALASPRRRREMEHAAERACVLLLISVLLAALGLASLNCREPRKVDHQSQALLFLMLVDLEAPLEPLTDAEYNALNAQQKYRVVNKHLGTLYTGAPLAEVFDLGGGLNDLQPREGFDRYPSWVRSQLATQHDPQTIQAAESAAFDHEFGLREQETPLALMRHMPLGKKRYDLWMAYILANSVQYSPAYELESVRRADMASVFNRLYAGIREDKPIREIIYDHMISEENWRRFRSPEDNTREMMELFLFRFRDDEVPKAAQACRNWSLDEDGDLVVDYDGNSEPQQILETEVTSCYDFYRAVANHPMAIPTTAGALVKTFYAGMPEEFQMRVIHALAFRNPKTYREMFNLILNSKSYLLAAERGKFYEETFWNLSAKTFGYAERDHFRTANRALERMNQRTLYYKLGRPFGQPNDSLSMAEFHAALRERAALDRKNSAGNANDGGWQEQLEEVPFTGATYIRYLFLNTIEREPSDEELATILQILENENINPEKNKTAVTYVVLDYCTRLAETYVHRMAIRPED